ncbi:WD40-repeat-containing domain protein [Xylariaceae sp. FL0255]|nr:WD40-repeat-containing domain protein [Xylariaceae sp. FL0255]
MSSMEGASARLSHQNFGNSHAADGGFSFQGNVSGNLAIHHARDNQLEPLDELPEAAFNAAAKQHTPSCLNGTRRALLQHIGEWVDDQGGKHIYWLRGMAGTGKSTITLTIARHYAQLGRLGASFFFSRGGGDVASAVKFPTAIAGQLIRAIPKLKKHVHDVMFSTPRIRETGLFEQWDKLVLKPMSLLGQGASSHPIVVVIDALDECDNEDDATSLIQCLASATLIKNVSLRVFITSRPEQPIKLGFEQISRDTHQEFVLHDIEHSVVDQDLTLYYQERLKHTAKRFSLGDHFYTDETIKILVQRSHRLFIHAATVCRFVHGGGQLAKDRLSRLVNSEHSSGDAEKELDQMYTTVLESAFPLYHKSEEATQIHASFGRIVGSIVVLFDTMTFAELSTLLGEPEDKIRPILLDIHSVLEVPEDASRRIRLVHPSFRDFLVDPTRHLNEVFSIDIKRVHRDLLLDCLRIMKTHLRINMCHIGHPGVKVREVPPDTINRAIPHLIQYACRHWLSHLYHSGCDPNGIPEVEEFFRTRFIFWLESLAWTGRLSEGIDMIRSLEATMAPQPIASESKALFHILKKTWKRTLQKSISFTSLHSMVYDAMRFVISNSSTIVDAPLQVYCSALLFSPQESIVRKLYEHLIPRWITQRPLTSVYWGSHLLTLRHTASISCIAYSPDGRFLASASGHSIQLWDAITGRKERTFSHVRVSVISFSPDGKHIAAASHYDKNVQLRNAITGKLDHIFKGHENTVAAIAFSPNGKFLASGSSDRTVRLWDVIAGGSRVLRGHTSTVLGVAFSADGRLIASGSQDKTVRLWPINTLKPYSLHEHDGFVSAVACSPNGRSLASVSWDGTVRLWDVATKQSHTFRGHGDSVGGVAFSPDGRLLASGGSDTSVRIWDTVSGQIQHKLEGHSLFVRSLAFSPDGRFLASGSQDGSARLWDVANIAIARGTAVFERQQNPVRGIILSPDNRFAATWNDYYPQTIFLWNINTGQKQRLLRVSHNAHVHNLTFSPDGRFLALFHAGKAQIWDVTTGRKRSSFSVKTIVNAASVGLSSHAKYLVLTSLEGSAIAWDIDKGQEQQFIPANTFRGWNLALSPNSQLTALSLEGTMQLWNLSTRQMIHTLQAGVERVTRIIFSLDGRLIASFGLERTVRLWNAATGLLVGTWPVQVDGDLDKCVLSLDNTRLLTDRGAISLSSDEEHIRASLYVSETWVQQGGMDLIYLHPDYQPLFFYAFNDTVHFYYPRSSALRIDGSAGFMIN